MRFFLAVPTGFWRSLRGGSCVTTAKRKDRRGFQPAAQSAAGRAWCHSRCAGRWQPTHLSADLPPSGSPPTPTSGEKQFLRRFSALSTLDLGHGGDCPARGAAAGVAVRQWRCRNSSPGCSGLGGTTLVACVAADLQRLGVIEGIQRRNPGCADDA